MIGAVETARSVGVADMLVALVKADGTAAHGYPGAAPLRDGSDALRNLADVAHYLCVLHGRFPGVIDHAADRTDHAAALGWLAAAAEGFVGERALLTRLAVATGPVPSTPGQAECEAAVLQQRHALDMLGRSDRRGCALGAAFALVLDWLAVRAVLELAAHRAGVAAAPLALPSEAETRTVAMAFADSAALERAMSFGAQQMLAQQRGLWDLLEARQVARARL
jgi:hypothetical protein